MVRSSEKGPGITLVGQVPNSAGSKRAEPGSGPVPSPSSEPKLRSRVLRTPNLPSKGSSREACIGGLPVSYIPGNKQEHNTYPLSKLENIPLIKVPKYPISLEVNKNIHEITYTK